MKPSNRILIAGIIIELGLGALGAFLLFQLRTGGLKSSTSSADTISTITSVLGGAMGLLGGLLLVVYIILRKRGS
jgi:hypothetical protein